MTAVVAETVPSSWTNERLKLTCKSSNEIMNIWKMIVLDSNNNKKSKKNTFSINCINGTEYITSKEKQNKMSMSLLKFLAINALELSAPASPILLQQTNLAPLGWLQLAGHPESIAPAANGIVRKRISGISDSEAIAYRGISKDLNACKLVPKFQGIHEINGETYLELQDLLDGFHDPAVMDIKMGRRTFLESEVKNESLRNDLYNKMVKINNSAPTIEEHNCKAITKLRYMLFREQISSSASKGFRCEALKMKGSSPITDLKTVKNCIEVEETISCFLNDNKYVTKELIKRLKTMRTLIEKSVFFQTHETVGSSVFIVYDDQRVGAWLIDFAKARRLPEGIKVDHRRSWVQGNYEEGLLHGFDELIKLFEKIYIEQRKSTTR